MKQEEDNKKKNEKEDDGTFLSKVMDFFIKLMDKFTDGKYSTKEEQEFFADEKNLYDENGDITPEYQRRIDEFEEQLRNKNVDDFLHEIHSTDSEEFGPAYNETEMAILENSNEYISSQEQIAEDLENSKIESAEKDNYFDLDAWLDEYVKEQGICENGDKAREIIKKMILDELEIVDRELDESEMIEIIKGMNVRECIQKIIDDTIAEKEV